MIIRKIKEDDATRFLELQKSVDQSGFMLFEPGERQWTVEQQQQSINRILSEENSIIFVAEENQQLAGFIVGLGSQLIRNKHSAYLVLGVHEDFRGKGVATQLFQQIFNWAKERGITRLGLTVIKTNEKAIRLYKKMGFEIEGEKVHSLIIDGKAVNEYYMYKLI